MIKKSHFYIKFLLQAAFIQQSLNLLDIVGFINTKISKPKRKPKKFGESVKLLLAILKLKRDWLISCHQKIQPP